MAGEKQLQRAASGFLFNGGLIEVGQGEPVRIMDDRPFNNEKSQPAMVTTQSTSAQPSDVMTPTAFGNQPIEDRRGTARRILNRLFCDKRSNASRPKLLFAVTAIDFAIVAGSGLLAVAMAAMPELGWTSGRALSTVTLVALATIATLHGNWGYTIQALRNISGQGEKIIRSLLSVFCLIAGGTFLARVEFFTPQITAFWLALSAAGMVGSRFAVADILDRLTRAGRLVRRTVIVGGGTEAETLIRTLESEQLHHIEILGVFDDRQDERSADTFCGYPKLGTFAQLSAFCRNAGTDLLIVTVPFAAEQRLLQIMSRLFAIPVDIRISAQSSKLRLNARAYTHIGSVPMLAVMDRPLTDWSRAVKNIEDRVVGACLLLAAAPVMLLAAIAVRLDSKGPVLFKQKRFGFNNELIEVYKFRSMYTDMTDADAAKLATRDDPRITRAGRFLRRSSLDELPQLFNVIRGEMSLVGPRPHATQAKADADLYQSVVDGYFARHRMKPGLTGWAQIKGWRGETDTHEKIQKRVEHDLYYIDNWSVPLDLYIIAMTPLSLITGKNAY